MFEAAFASEPVNASFNANSSGGCGGDDDDDDNDEDDEDDDDEDDDEDDDDDDDEDDDDDDCILVVLLDDEELFIDEFIPVLVISLTVRVLPLIVGAPSPIGIDLVVRFLRMVGVSGVISLMIGLGTIFIGLSFVRIVVKLRLTEFFWC